MSFGSEILRSATNDKLAHFIVGMAIGIFGVWNVTWTLICIHLIALGKELYDFSNDSGGDIEFCDYAATVAGGCLTITLIKIVEMIRVLWEQI